ncbi:O-methyltransferase [Catellatospora sp. TT07R-123]|uniref:O-methyltransferase n=1 Tax=Catellatospora sp. TT07R-123 TaxID=2733863 RepID=UPI001B221F02|nr:class I SAM-dependent methyltransferase [Catellatospora sp. TT07R-123]GHJ50291.1 O-methyltransferase [Catellatospora sp. TT07R-123]
MSRNFITVTEELHDYVVRHGTPLDELQLALRAETEEATGSAAGMQIEPEYAAFLTMLTKLTGVRQAVEVGTFTGMSSLAIARGMAEDGRLTCFDVSEEYTSIARRYWARAGLADRIELRLGPAAEGLARLPEQPYLDLAFIDADKESYRTYWELLVPRMRSGGLIIADNTLWSGRVLHPEPDDEETEAIVAFNAAVAADPRVEPVMLPFSDGVTLARIR